MKIKLLNHGGYRELKGVKFPVVVEAFRYGTLRHVAGVKMSELIRVGADINIDTQFLDLSFLVGCECEVIDE